MTTRWGDEAPSIQTRSGTHRGDLTSMPPDQKVTGFPSASLSDAPLRHAMNLTTRCASPARDEPDDPMRLWYADVALRQRSVGECGSSTRGYGELECDAMSDFQQERELLSVERR